MNRLAFLLLFVIAVALDNARGESKPGFRTTTPSIGSAGQSPAAANGDKKKSQDPANDSNENKPSDSTPAIELKNRSSFQMEGDNRNPFWPIGWKPTETSASANTEHAAGEIPATAFLVSSITMDKKTRFAIVNGKTMQEGQQFGLQVGTQTYQLTVKAIEDGRVILSRRNQEIIIPLRRK